LARHIDDDAVAIGDLPDANRGGRLAVEIEDIAANDVVIQAFVLPDRVFSTLAPECG
jgi:hypothetical protein